MLRKKKILTAALGFVGCSLLADPYLETSGEQAVNTGYYPNPKTKIVIDWEYLSNDPKQQRIFGGMDVANRCLFYFVSYINGGGGYSWACQDYNGNWTPTAAPLVAPGMRRTLTLDGGANQVTITDGGTNLVQTITQKHTNKANVPLILFGRSKGDLLARSFECQSKVRFYSMQVYEGDKLLHDYQPRICGNEGVVYDTVAQVAFKSATATPIIASEDCASVAGPALAEPSSVNGLYSPQMGSDGIEVENVAYDGPFIPRGDETNAASGSVTFRGNNAFGGFLSLYYAPQERSPREYTYSGWSKDYKGATDPNKQVTYAITGDLGGRTTFAGGWEDLTAGQRGDVTLLDGNFTFGGNVTPNGNDGYLVFKRGDIQVGGIRMVGGRGHNSRVIVNSGATVRCAGDVFESAVHGGNPFHLYVDGTLSVDGVLSPYNRDCTLQSPGGTGVLNAHAVDAGGTTFAVPTLNVGAGGAACAGTKFNGATIGCYDGDATFTGSYSFGAAAPVLRASTVDGAAANITLQGAPTATARIAKTGAGALVIDTPDVSGLAGGIDVQAGALIFATATKVEVPVTVSAGATLGATANGAAELTNVTLGSGATLVLETSPTSVGSVKLPAGAVKGPLAVVVEGANPPPAQTVATVLSGANLAQADLANITLTVNGGKMEGELSVKDGDLVLTVTKSLTAPARTLTWAAGASTAWDLTALNWLGGGVATAFAEFDNVRFADVAGNIVVAQDGVQAGKISFEGEGETYALTGGQIGGASTLTIDNGATVDLGAKLDKQEIVVRNGILRPTKTDAELLGDPNVPIRVLDGGTFDLNIRAATAADRLMTHSKKYVIQGEGATDADGQKLGALVNRGPVADTQARLNAIELSGDALIRGGTGRIDMRISTDGPRTTRPSLKGPDHVLTIGNQSLCVVDGDVNVRKICVTNGALISFEGSSRETIPDGVHLNRGSLQTWGHSQAFSQPVFVEGAVTSRICNGSSTVTISGPVDVAADATLNLQNSNWASMKYTGDITGEGRLLSSAGGVSHLVGNVAMDEITVAGGMVVYGDGTAAGDGKKYPTNIVLNAGYTSAFVALAPSADSTLSGYTVSGTGGSFVPSRQAPGSKVVTTVENTTVSGESVSISMGFGTNTTNQTRMDGTAVLGQGFRAENVNGIHLGIHPASGDASLTLGEGSSVKVKENGEIVLGLWSGTTNNLHRLVVDGGTLDASEAKPAYVGYDGRSAEMLVKSGTAKLKGVSTRFHNAYNLKPLQKIDPRAVSGIGYEVFGMSGGTVELAGSITTERAYPYVPQLFLGGGTLKSMVDWSTDFYQYAMFETWGDSRDTTKKTFTLDTNGKTTTFRSALQGNANVKLTGAGSFVADDGVQGGVSGHWTVENTGAANLKNAAAFADGLTVAPGSHVEIDIGDRSTYVSLAVLCNAKDALGDNEFTQENFYSHPSVFPSLFTKDVQNLITKATTPFFTAYRHEAEFYVDKKETYTFAIAYDDRGDIMVDGTRVAYNASWDSVGTGQIALEPGWHRISVTCKDNAGGAGPTTSKADPKTFHDAKMAAGFHIGAITSTQAADYTPISSTTMKMRPVSSVRWNHRYTNAKVPDDWNTNDSYTFSMVTNSMRGIHDTGWNMNAGALNSYTGWTYVEPKDAGQWAVDGVYDDRIGLFIDGKKVFENATWNAAKSGSFEITPGWHKFKVTVSDGEGGWSWSGVPGYGAALYVKRPTDAAKVPFDERNIRMTAEPYGFIGGALVVGEGATVANTSATACEIIGTVEGTGSLTGKFALSGTWKMSMEDGRTLKTVTWTDGVDLKNGTLDIALTKKKPVSANFALGKVTGVEGLSQAELDAKLNVTLDGEEDPGRFSLVVQNGQASLRNLKPSGSVFYLR